MLIAVLPGGNDVSYNFMIAVTQSYGRAFPFLPSSWNSMIERMQPPISTIEKTVLAYVILFSALGTYLAIFNPAYFHSIYTVEDGIIEWLQFVAVATTCLVLFARLMRSGKNKRWKLLPVGLLAALAFFFVAGEEISWGQRIFQIETPEYFLEKNAQQETNLHNLVIGEKKVNRIITNRVLPALMLSYLLLLIPLYHRNASVRRWCDQWGIPIAKNYQICAYFLVVLLVELLIKSFADAPRRGELTEFAGYFIVMLNVVFPHNADALHQAS